MTAVEARPVTRGGPAATDTRSQAPPTHTYSHGSGSGPGNPPSPVVGDEAAVARRRGRSAAASHCPSRDEPKAPPPTPDAPEVDRVAALVLREPGRRHPHERRVDRLLSAPPLRIVPTDGRRETKIERRRVTGR